VTARIHRPWLPLIRSLDVFSERKISVRRISKAVVLTAAAGAVALGTAGQALANDDSGASATGASVKSSGVLTGNVVQVPINLPVNACGNNVLAIVAANSGSITCLNATR
jgi:hypothetical protein